MSLRVTPLLLGLNAVLALGLAVLWFGPYSSTQWKPPAAQSPNLADARAARLGSSPGITAEFPQIVDRPVFFTSRRPLSPEAGAKASDTAAPPPPVALDKLKMFGTINGPTMRGVLANVEGESRFIRSGETVGEWTLRSISSSEATFEKGDEKRVVPLPLASSGDAGKATAGKGAAANSKTAKVPVPPARPKAATPPPNTTPAPVPARAPATPPAQPAAKASGPIVGSWGP